MTSLRPTDAQLREAFVRRAGADLPSDLRGSVLTAIASEPQRWSWATRAAEAFSRPSRRGVVLALALVALLVAATAAIALVGMHDQQPDGLDRGIVFVSNGDLWVADVDGTNERLVWDVPGTIIPARPTWVDAETIVMQGLPGGVYAVDLRTSTPRLLAEAGGLLAISPDHRQVAIGLDRVDGSHLLIIEIASGLPVADFTVEGSFGPQVGLTGGPHTWSPDGRWLLGQGFRSDASATSGWVYRVDVQTGAIRDLAIDLCCGLHQPNPKLSPDGSRVAFVNYHQAVQGEVCDFRCGTLWSLDPETGTRVQLTAEAGSEIGPVFSPDGTWIAFMDNDTGAGFDIAIIRSDGTGLRKLTGSADAFAPAANLEPYEYLAWDADGSGLTFMRLPGREPEYPLWHVTLAGQVEQRLGTYLVSEFAR